MSTQASTRYYIKYDDRNGYWHVIDTGSLVAWCYEKRHAERIADALNAEDGGAS